MQAIIFGGSDVEADGEPVVVTAKLEPAVIGASQIHTAADVDLAGLANGESTGLTLIGGIADRSEQIGLKGSTCVDSSLDLLDKTAGPSSGVSGDGYELSGIMDIVPGGKHAGVLGN